jgi:hypothetical protein
MYVGKIWTWTKVHVSRLITDEMRFSRGKWKEKPEKKE